VDNFSLNRAAASCGVKIAGSVAGSIAAVISCCVSLRFILESPLESSSRQFGIMAVHSRGGARRRLILGFLSFGNYPQDNDGHDIDDADQRQY
jgi:hypothetical protein